MIDHAISSNRVITPTGIRRAAVIISRGKIRAVVDEIPTGDFPITHANDLVLMPGITDPHVHINEPGRTNWEGFDTATKAAIAGGITSLVEMPLNASPVTTTAKAFDEKIKAARGQLHANCGFWGGIIPGNEGEIVPLIEKGVMGFKAFLTDSGIDEFPPVGEMDLRKVMPLIANAGLPLLVHCELTGPVPAPGNNLRSYRNYLQSRPTTWEDNAISLMIRLCGEYNCRTHIVHLSSAGSIAQIRKAKEKGLPLTVETAQHYLYFSAENIPDGRPEYKCAPPIREKENNRLLWEALQEGVIDFVATDHSPAPAELKERLSGDLFKAWGGIASLQFALPVLWTTAKSHGAGIEDMARWLCENPAKLPGLDTIKGKIAAGYDADLVLWDPDHAFTVSEEMILHRNKITPYLGEKLFGSVSQTWLGGIKIFDDGKFLHLNKGSILYHG